MDFLKSIVNSIDLAVVLFNRVGELEVYNGRTVEFWRLNEDFLGDRPSVVEFFEVVREKGILPEKDNFREFCNRMSELCRSNDNYERMETLILPNGKSIEERIIKNEVGLIIMWEDITERQDIVRNLSSYKNLYNRLVEKNPKALIIVGSNGGIESYNSRFLELFNLKSDYLDEKIHVRELLNRISLFDERAEDKAITLGNLVSNRSFHSEIDLEENKRININGIYLQNGHTFIQWELESKSIMEVEIETSSVLDLHNNLIFDLNEVIGSPLSNIIGFADLLQNEYVGKLNLRQKEYIEKIISKAEFINSELGYKIELTELESNKREIEIERVDLNIVISNVLHHVRSRIKSKNISIKLEIEDILYNIDSNEFLLNKSLSLLLMYIIEQNNNNSEIFISIGQKDGATSISFKDTSKETLFSNEDLKSRYDINLALSILKRLKLKNEYSSKNRSHRMLVIQSN